MAVTLSPHKELIRKLAALGYTDERVAAGLGSKGPSICCFRSRNGIPAGRKARIPGRPRTVYKALVQCEQLFSNAMAGRTYTDASVIPIGRMSAHLAHTLGMGASSAWTCAEAGEKSGGWF